MELVVAKSMAQTSFTMLLMAIAAAIALALSAVGIYGVIAYVVGQRRSEIGIRIALGAQVGAVTRLVVGQSLAIVAAGVALGIRLRARGDTPATVAAVRRQPQRSVGARGDGGSVADRRRARERGAGAARGEDRSG